VTDDQALKSMGDARSASSRLPLRPNHDSRDEQEFVKDYNDATAQSGLLLDRRLDGMHAIYEALKKTSGKTDGER
jgi:branched-chain amino acid transport system substrate-binding protein